MSNAHTLSFIDGRASGLFERAARVLTRTLAVAAVVAGGYAAATPPAYAAACAFVGDLATAPAVPCDYGGHTYDRAIQWWVGTSTTYAYNTFWQNGSTTVTSTGTPPIAYTINSRPDGWTLDKNWAGGTSEAQGYYNGTGFGAWGTIWSNPETRVSEIYTFTISGVTATITGWWNTHATSTESIQIVKSSVLGMAFNSDRSFTATTSGVFSFTFDIVPDYATMGVGSTTYTLSANTKFDATLWQDFDDYDTFYGSGTPPVILDTASVTLAATTSSTTISLQEGGAYSIPEFDCSVTQPTGCLKNAGIWLLYPSVESVQQIQSLTLRGRFPFQYVYDMGTVREELFKSAQTASSTISITVPFIPGRASSTITFLSAAKLAAVPYSDTIRTILGWLLWLMLAEYVYYRVIRVHDPVTPH